MEGRADEKEKHSATRKCCGGCCSKLTGIVCSNLGVCLLVLLYTIAGAFLFATIEGGSRIYEVPSIQSVTSESADTTSPPDKAEPVITTIKNIEKIREETVERLWAITESLNILYRDNWTRVAERELSQYTESLLNMNARHAEEHLAASRDSSAKPNHWSFAGSFLYSLTIITTIGYGSVAPATALGKLVTILYALLGIPLMLLYLSSVGDSLSRFLKWVWSGVCGCCKRKKPKSPTVPLGRPNLMPGAYSNLEQFKNGKWKGKEYESGPVPVTLCLTLMIAYMCGGAAIFSYTHSWPFLHAIYFCFTSLTTIGFGDLSPGLGARSEMGLQLSMLGASIYLLIGMALIATCFNLMQEQVTRGTGFSRRLGGLLHSGHIHYDDT